MITIAPRHARAMRAHDTRTCAAFALCLALCAFAAAPAAADAPRADLVQAWRTQVASISDGADTPAREAAIARRLDAMGIAWRAEEFELDGKRGRNLLADLGGADDAPLLLVGAHYDRVDVGHGATDNASGVATVLALAQALQARPLAAHRVKLAFWDLEEHGLLGSRAWVAAPGQERPALYVNFDVFGWGDTLWMMAPEAGDPLVEALRRSSAAEGIGLQAGQAYPPTDHRAFLQAGWPAVSFSLVGGDEIAGILDVFAGRRPAQAPKVTQVIHSPQDDATQLDSRHVPAALRALEAGLRAWDAAAGTPR
ncbi:M28 family metallopeptidase [Pseudoxanthomonas broegbernensis]|nr:M28 family metallopeptidase [Pseudoxanthomonas broegbernensis]MBB6065116.1 hypothetical protein [Pseudoxanthomonas broegbernensis]